MNHNEIRHMLSEYIDGAVSPEDRTAIEEHLKTCERCSDALKELRQTVAVIRTVEELDPPAFMTQKIMAKVRVEAAKKSWFNRLFFPLHIKLPLEQSGSVHCRDRPVHIPERGALNEGGTAINEAEVEPAVVHGTGNKTSLAGAAQRSAAVAGM
jgi:anti-sigma factor RsiW